MVVIEIMHSTSSGRWRKPSMFINSLHTKVFYLLSQLEQVWDLKTLNITYYIINICYKDS